MMLAPKSQTLPLRRDRAAIAKVRAGQIVDCIIKTDGLPALLLRAPSEEEV
jgi:hypothetical protein